MGTAKGKKAVGFSMKLRVGESTPQAFSNKYLSSTEGLQKLAMEDGGRKTAAPVPRVSKCGIKKDVTEG